MSMDMCPCMCVCVYCCNFMIMWCIVHLPIWGQIKFLLLLSSSTGAAEVVAGVYCIPALHHPQLMNVCFRVWVPDSASVLQNWTYESLVGPFLDRCWCSVKIPLEEGTSVVGLLGCLVDVLRPCTVLVESYSKVLCCVSHLQYMPVDVILGDDRRWLPYDSQ